MKDGIYYLECDNDTGLNEPCDIPITVEIILLLVWTVQKFCHHLESSLKHLLTIVARRFGLRLEGRG